MLYDNNAGTSGHTGINRLVPATTVGDSRDAYAMLCSEYDCSQERQMAIEWMSVSIGYCHTGMPFVCHTAARCGILAVICTDR